MLMDTHGMRVGGNHNCAQHVLQQHIHSAGSAGVALSSPSNLAPVSAEVRSPWGSRDSGQLVFLAPKTTFLNLTTVYCLTTGLESARGLSPWYSLNTE